MIESFLPLASKALGVVERVKDITTKKLSAVVGGLALRCGWLLAFANAALIIIKHIDFRLSSKWLRLGFFRETAEQSSATSQ